MTTTIITRRDAVQYVEDRLGSEGSRAIAEAMVSGAGWQHVATLTDAQWAEVLDEAIAETTATSCDECGERLTDVRHVSTASRNANVCRACVP